MRFFVGLFLSIALFACTQSAPPVPSGGYQITLQFSPNVAPRFRSVFESAKGRWENIITGDLTNIDQKVPASRCLAGFSDVDSVDDVVIQVETFTEAPGGLLGQAGPCLIRLTDGLTLVGVMRFDTADLDRLAAVNNLESTIVHEMGHVLGIGTLWENKGLIQLANPARASDTCDTNPQYIGAKGKLEWQALGRTGNVPLEKGFGTGTCEGHWDEATFNKELMTGFLDPGLNPLSRLSIASLEDLGYNVNYTPADIFTLIAPLIRLENTNTEHLHSEPFPRISTF